MSPSNYLQWWSTHTTKRQRRKYIFPDLIFNFTTRMSVLERQHVPARNWSHQQTLKERKWRVAPPHSPKPIWKSLTRSSKEVDILLWQSVELHEHGPPAVPTSSARQQCPALCLWEPSALAGLLTHYASLQGNHFQHRSFKAWTLTSTFPVTFSKMQVLSYLLCE